MDLYWLQNLVEPLVESIDQPGSGGVIFAIIFSIAAMTYLLSTRWILKGEASEVPKGRTKSGDSNRDFAAG